jgi:hypothetical protein
MPNKVELISRIKKYVETHKLNKDVLTCNELDQIAKECKCSRLDVMSWFRYGTIL